MTAVESQRPDPAAFGRGLGPGLGINLLVSNMEVAIAFQTGALRADIVWQKRTSPSCRATARPGCFTRTAPTVIIRSGVPWLGSLRVAAARNSDFTAAIRIGLQRGPRRQVEASSVRRSTSRTGYGKPF